MSKSKEAGATREGAVRVCAQSDGAKDKSWERPKTSLARAVEESKRNKVTKNKLKEELGRETMPPQLHPKKDCRTVVQGTTLSRT